MTKTSKMIAELHKLHLTRRHEQLVLRENLELPKICKNAKAMEF